MTTGGNEIEARKVRAEIDAANEQLEQAVEEHQRVAGLLQEQLKRLGSNGMLSEQAIAHGALVNFETVGDLPDLETFDLCFKELLVCEGLANRYRRLVDECHHAEHLRHLPTSHSPASRPENEQTPSDD